MKKIKAILVLSAILFLCAFVFAACGSKESGYVGMLQFSNKIWSKRNSRSCQKDCWGAASERTQEGCFAE